MNIETFFDVKDFFHKDLFNEEHNLWDPLSNLVEYLQKNIKSQIDGKVSPDAFVDGGAALRVEKGAIVEPGAYIEGFCVIGANSRIRSGAYIRGPVLIGNDCVVGHGTEMKHSIMLNKSSIPHFSYIGDSIIGNNVNVGAGTIFSNFRLDGKEINIRVEGKKFPTERRKLGAIIGDGVKIGCKCVLNPGTVIGPHSHCYPSLSLSGYHKEKSLIKKGLS